MSKINVVSTHNSVDKYYYQGVKNENKIMYQNDFEHITVKIDENISITKNIEDSNIKMNFELDKITECIYETSYLGSVILHIKTKVLEVENNRIYIEYNILESNDFHAYEIEYEVVS